MHPRKGGNGLAGASSRRCSGSATVRPWFGCSRLFSRLTFAPVAVLADRGFALAAGIDARSVAKVLVVGA